VGLGVVGEVIGVVVGLAEVGVGSGVVGIRVGGESGHSGTFSGQSHSCLRSLNHNPS
jgi:hypothetical protein